jgi:hypothetical protein
MKIDLIASLFPKITAAGTGDGAGEKSGGNGSENADFLSTFTDSAPQDSQKNPEKLVQKTAVPVDPVGVENDGVETGELIEIAEENDWDLRPNSGESDVANGPRDAFDPLQKTPAPVQNDRAQNAPIDFAETVPSKQMTSGETIPDPKLAQPIFPVPSAPVDSPAAKHETAPITQAAERAAPSKSAEAVPPSKVAPPMRPSPKSTAVLDRIQIHNPPAPRPVLSDAPPEIPQRANQVVHPASQPAIELPNVASDAKPHVLPRPSATPEPQNPASPQVQAPTAAPEDNTPEPKVRDSEAALQPRRAPLSVPLQPKETQQAAPQTPISPAPQTLASPTANRPKPIAEPVTQSVTSQVVPAPLPQSPAPKLTPQAVTEHLQKPTPARLNSPMTPGPVVKSDQTQSIDIDQQSAPTNKARELFTPPKAAPAPQQTLQNPTAPLTPKIRQPIAAQNPAPRQVSDRPIPLNRDHLAAPSKPVVAPTPRPTVADKTIAQTATSTPRPVITRQVTRPVSEQPVSALARAAVPVSTQAPKPASAQIPQLMSEPKVTPRSKPLAEPSAKDATRPTKPAPTMPMQQIASSAASYLRDRPQSEPKLVVPTKSPEMTPAKAAETTPENAGATRPQRISVPASMQQIAPVITKSPTNATTNATRPQVDAVMPKPALKHGESHKLPATPVNQPMPRSDTPGVQTAPNSRPVTPERPAPRASAADLTPAQTQVTRPLHRQTEAEPVARSVTAKPTAPANVLHPTRAIPDPKSTPSLTDRRATPQAQPTEIRRTQSAVPSRVAPETTPKNTPNSAERLVAERRNTPLPNRQDAPTQKSQSSGIKMVPQDPAPTTAQPDRKLPDPVRVVMRKPAAEAVPQTRPPATDTIPQARAAEDVKTTQPSSQPVSIKSEVPRPVEPQPVRGSVQAGRNTTEPTIVPMPRTAKVAPFASATNPKQPEPTKVPDSAPRAFAPETPPKLVREREKTDASRPTLTKPAKVNEPSAGLDLTQKPAVATQKPVELTPVKPMAAPAKVTPSVGPTEPTIDVGTQPDPEDAPAQKTLGTLDALAKPVTSPITHDQNKILTTKPVVMTEPSVESLVPRAEEPKVTAPQSAAALPAPQQTAPQQMAAPMAPIAINVPASNRASEPQDGRRDRKREMSVATEARTNRPTTRANPRAGQTPPQMTAPNPANPTQTGPVSSAINPSDDKPRRDPSDMAEFGLDQPRDLRPGIAVARDPMMPMRPDMGRNIAEQIAQVAQKLADGPVEITLKPEELGKLRMQMITHDTGISMIVTAERPETIDLMRRHIDQLAQEYRELGYENISFAFGQEGGAQNDGDGSDHPNSDQKGPLNPANNEPGAENMTQTANISDAQGVDIRL